MTIWHLILVILLLPVVLVTLYLVPYLIAHGYFDAKSKFLKSFGALTNLLKEHSDEES